MSEEKKNTYITIHRSFVREGIEYTDPKTGESKSFNSVTLPKDTLIGDQDVSYYSFSPLFVNESKFFGDDFREIPLRSGNEVWLHKTLFDENGNPVVGEDGKIQKDIVKVMPEQIKEALAESRQRYLDSRAEAGKTLEERADQARESSEAMTQGDVPFDRDER